jgi:hypothetical protein
LLSFPPPPPQDNFDQKATAIIQEAGFTTMEMECDTVAVLAVKRVEEPEREVLEGFSSGSWLDDF